MKQQTLNSASNGRTNPVKEKNLSSGRANQCPKGKESIRIKPLKIGFRQKSNKGMIFKRNNCKGQDEKSRYTVKVKTWKVVFFLFGMLRISRIMHPKKVRKTQRLLLFLLMLTIMRPYIRGTQQIHCRARKETLRQQQNC